MVPRLSKVLVRFVWTWLTSALVWMVIQLAAPAIVWAQDAGVASDAGAVAPSGPRAAQPAGADGGASRPASSAARVPSRPPVAATEEQLGSAPELPPTDTEMARGQPIVLIEVVGNQRVPTEDIMTYLREKAGQLFRPEELTRDVKELWDSGYFDDISVDMVRTDAGVTLRFIVRERSSIQQITYDGNSEIDTDKLEEAVEIKTGTILSYPSIRGTVQKIRDMYAEKGYFLAEVEFEVVPQRNNEVIVKFHIKEHDQVSVRRITFIGNDHVSEDDLREVMYTGQSGFFSFGSGGSFRQDAFERDVMMINSLYYDRGYLSVQVAAPRVNLTPDRTGIEVTITIMEGPQYRIRRLRLYERDAEGREVEPLNGRRHLREMIHAKSGDVFARAALAHDLQTVRTMYRDAGFANVEADPETLRLLGIG